MARPRHFNRVFRHNRYYTEQQLAVIESKLSGGMVTTLDSTDIPNNSFLTLKNARVYFDRIQRRSGLDLMSPTKPNSNVVLGVYAYQKNNGDSFLIRATKDGLHYWTVSGWTAITGSLAGTNKDKFRFVTFNDRLVFSNNGANKIQIVNTGVTSFGDLGNAPKYKYVAGFNNRVIGANLAGSDPTQVGWSGNLNITVWDNASDISANLTSLVESPEDRFDEITGIFGMTNVLVIMREHNIWLATRNPSASNPFNFYTAIPGLGCDSPNSISTVPGGLIWADTHTKRVYLWDLNSAPVPISNDIESDLFRSTIDPEMISSSFNKTTLIYKLIVGSPVSNTKRVWLYDLRMQKWTYDEYDLIDGIYDVEGMAPIVTIDDLVGTIDGLVGTIDDLGGFSNVKEYQQYIATLNGDILVENPNNDKDVSTPFTTVVESKDYELDLDDEQFITEIDIRFTVESSISGTLYYSKDYGESWIKAKDFSFTKGTRELQWKCNVRTQIFRWKVEFTGFGASLHKYEVYILKAGKDRVRQA